MKIHSIEFVRFKYFKLFPYFYKGNFDWGYEYEYVNGMPHGIIFGWAWVWIVIILEHH